MSTRGVYGFRKNNMDKLSYNHQDSYPIGAYEDGSAFGLGYDMAIYCRDASIQDMERLFDAIQLVDECGTPSKEDIETINSVEEYETQYSDPKYTDWYGLLRRMQGDLLSLSFVFSCTGKAYMTNAYDFIKDSVFCEYGYIINLDTKKLEFWSGWQCVPDKENRYGTKKDGGYYPCKLAYEVNLYTLYQAKEEDLRNILFKAEEALNAARVPDKQPA